MTDTMPRVGLDVHANQTHLFSLDVASGEFVRKRIDGPPTETQPHLQALGPRSIAVYEAGPTGFGLARAGAELGLDIRIAAPGLIPKAPTDRVKTDRRDAERLARLLAAGGLHSVRVPSIAEERFRDLIRCREDLRGVLMRARHCSPSSCCVTSCATRALGGAGLARGRSPRPGQSMPAACSSRPPTTTPASR